MNYFLIGKPIIRPYRYDPVIGILESQTVDLKSEADLFLWKKASQRGDFFLEWFVWHMAVKVLNE